jgi:hypothetical protein
MVELKFSIDWYWNNPDVIWADSSCEFTFSDILYRWFESQGYNSWEINITLDFKNNNFETIILEFPDSDIASLFKLTWG